MNNRASIAIFQNQNVPKENTRTPLVDADVFNAVLRVIKNKSTELVQTKDSLYVVTYSETGPFTLKMNNWLPVRVITLYQWASGGVTEEEMSYHSTVNGSNTI